MIGSLRGTVLERTEAGTVLLEVGGARVLYTGDYNCEADRHLAAAELPRGAAPRRGVSTANRARVRE